MNPVFRILFDRLRADLLQEQGQDLVEYALVVALIAFGAITSMQFLASSLNNAFSSVAATLSTSIT